jgi:hypothetical protein
MSRIDRPCPRVISRAEHDLRWEYAKGLLSLADFDRLMKKIKPLQKGGK